jgi:hypothetical protein
LAQLSWTEIDLTERSKAIRLTMPLDWIAAGLQVGSGGYPAWQLQQGMDKDVDDLELI